MRATITRQARRSRFRSPKDIDTLDEISILNRHYPFNSAESERLSYLIFHINLPMASTALSDRPKSRQYDNSDDLTRFDAEMEEAFNGFANRLDDDRDATVRDRLSATDVAEALGIDEEITISKRRKPIPKLDSAR